MPPVTTQQRPTRRATGLVITPRGRLVIVLGLVALLVVAVVGVGSLLSRGTSPAVADRPGATTPASTTGRPSTTSASASSATSTGARTLVRTGLVGSGTFRVSSVALAAVRRTSHPHTFVVRVEGGVDVDLDAAARQIHAILNDKRGWTGYEGASFAAVSDVKQADLVIYLASPPTVDKRCAPVDTEGKWSCGLTGEVYLNSDRWLHMTPTYDDLTAYRTYLVNHEVGHFLGRPHVACPAKGAVAPVMLTQSIAMKGCLRNGWPRNADIKGS